jgi:outer membrane protein OmpU
MSKYKCRKIGLSVVTAFAALSGASPSFAQFAPYYPVGSYTQIFGILNVGVTALNNVSTANGSGSQVKMQPGENSLSFFGFRGGEDLGGGNFAFFSLQSFVNLNNGTAGQGTAFFNKNAYVGLGNRQFGSVMLGRNDQFANQQCYVSGICWLGQISSLHPGNLDKIGGGNLSNMIKYASPQIGDFWFGAYYSLGDANGGTNTGRAIGADLAFKHGPVAINASYESINGANVAPLNPAIGFGTSIFLNQPVTPASVFNLQHQDIAYLGGRYELGNFIFSAVATNVAMKYRGVSDNFRTYEASVTYRFAPDISGIGGCWRSSFESSRWNTCQLAASYAFSKRTTVILAETFQRATGSNQKAQLFNSGPSTSLTQNAISIGIQERF